MDVDVNKERLKPIRKNGFSDFSLHLSVSWIYTLCDMGLSIYFSF